MRCSDCSALIRPVVAIDIDGTLADYHTHLIEFAEEWLGRPLSRAYDGREPMREFVARAWEVDHTLFRQIKLAFRQGGMKRTMQPYANASWLCYTLRDRSIGAEVWLTTTRPWERFDRVDPDTREWLSRQSIEFDGLLYHDDKMKELAERVDPARVVAVLDDQTDVLGDARDQGWFPILSRMHYNRRMPWAGHEADDLASAAAIIIQRITIWRNDHE